MYLKAYLHKTNKYPLPQGLMRAIQRIAPRSGRVLDIGCGTGRVAELLAQRGLSVTAIDASGDAIRYTRARCRDLPVRAYHKDMRKFRFRANTYAMIVAIHSLPFIKKEESCIVMEKIMNALLPGGVALLTLFGPDDDWSGREDMSFWTKEEVRDIWKDKASVSISEKRDIAPALGSGKRKRWHVIRVTARKYGGLSSSTSAERCLTKS